MSCTVNVMVPRVLLEARLAEKFCSWKDSLRLKGIAELVVAMARSDRKMPEYILTSRNFLEKNVR